MCVAAKELHIVDCFGGQTDFMPVYVVVTTSKNKFLCVQVSIGNRMNAGAIKNAH